MSNIECRILKSIGYLGPGKREDRRWFAGMHRAVVFLLLAILNGCLSGDTHQGALTIEASETTLQVTVAPLEIDPRILAERRFGEAPILADRVAGRELPPVSERLPENPRVVVPMEEIGTYGGTLRRALTGDIVQIWGPNKSLSENLMGYGRPDHRIIEHNIAETHWYEDEGRTAYFRIRKGMKWSDGHPYTVDDVLFWYNDMTMDDDARASLLPPSVWMIDDKPIRMEKVDDLTIRLTAGRPMGRILHAFSSDFSAYPKHRLKHLHPRYNATATYETFRDSTTDAQLILASGLPRLSAFVPVEWERGQRIVYERNPYYHKIDSAGNQLPYADRLTFTVIQDEQVILLKFINGEIDLFGRYAQISMYPTMKAQERNGKFIARVAPIDQGPAFYLNWDPPNPQLRDAFRDIRVRIAMSVALNREEISAIAYHNLLDPGGYSFGRSTPWYDAEVHKRYSEHDPAKARALLDGAGYVDSDGDGFREFKDGSPFSVTIDVMPGAWADICELAAEHWDAVGIRTHLNVALRDIVWPRRTNGTFEVHFWNLTGPDDPLVRMNEWAIMGASLPYWHRNATTEGPEWLWKATRHIKAALTSIDTAEVNHHMRLARDLHTDNVPVIATGSGHSIWGFNKRLGNVPYDASAGDVRRSWSRAVYHEQIYVRETVR
jgi:peptide/nickel transport system substrate-binding protein